MVLIGTNFQEELFVHYFPCGGNTDTQNSGVASKRIDCNSIRK